MSRQSRTPGLSAFSLPTPPPPSTSTISPSTTSTSPLPSTRQSLYSTYGTALHATNTSSLQTQLSVFRALLHNFALVHAAQIRADASFRGEFVRMCRAVGVDPSSSTGSAGGEGGDGGKAGWLGGLGGLAGVLKGDGIGGGGGNGGEQAREREVEIAVRVVEICRKRRGVDGGLTPLAVVRDGVAKGAGRGYEVGGEMAGVTEGDVERAVRSLEPLGAGFSVMAMGREGRSRMVRSVPRGLSEDQGMVMEAVQVLGSVTGGVLRDNFGWGAERVEAVCGDLVAEGVVWVDDQGEGGREFWGTGGLGGWED